MTDTPTPTAPASCPCGAPPGAICKKMDCLMLDQAPTRAQLLSSATADARAGTMAMHNEDWERATVFFRMAIDQMEDAGVLQNV